MSSWFEQLDLGSLQRELAKSVEEASGIINNVNKLDILNFDAMAEQEEADIAAAADEEESEEEEEIEAPVEKSSSSTIAVDDISNVETASARKLNFIENQKAIQTKMKENAKSVVRKLNYTPEDDIAERPSPTDEVVHTINVIKQSPIRPGKMDPSMSDLKRRNDILSANGSEEGELVEISLNSVENTPIVMSSYGNDRVPSTSVEDESEDNFGGLHHVEQPSAHAFHMSGSLTDDSSHSSYLSGGSRHGAFTKAPEVSEHPAVVTQNKKLNKKLAKQQLKNQQQSLAHPSADGESRPSMYRNDNPTIKAGPTVNTVDSTSKQESKQGKTKKVKTKAPKNLDFWGVTSTKKTLVFPKSSSGAPIAGALPAVPATPGSLNNTVPPETPGGGFEGYGATVRFSDDLTTPDKSTTNSRATVGSSSSTRNNISIGLLSDDTYGSDDLFQDHHTSSYSSNRADGEGNSLSTSISNTTSAMINNFLASRLVSSVTAPSSSSSSSNVTTEVASRFTFFDNVDEEVDLESDPILKRVKQNQANPNFQRETMAETASAVLARLYAGASQTYTGRVSANASGGSSGGGGSGGSRPSAEDVVNNPTIFQIFNTLLGRNPVPPTTTATRSSIAAPVTPRTEQRQQQQVMTRPPSVRVMVGNYIKLSLLFLWDNMFSTNGITVITALLFIYSYFKFQRYGTDAGDR